MRVGRGGKVRVGYGIGEGQGQLQKRGEGKRWRKKLRKGGGEK